MILGIALNARGYDPDPSSDDTRGLSGAYFASLGRIAEAAGLDFVSMGYGPSDRESLDALSLAAALISQTRAIGLCAVSPLVGWAPFNVARAFAAFDHLSLGRAGWCAVEGSDQAGWNLEFVEVVRELWDSWDDDAIVLDRETARFTDARRVRRINHRGAHFTVEGPLNAPRPPQGHPPFLVTARPGDDPALADAADVVILPAPDGAYRGRTARRVMLDLPTRLDDLADAEALADRMKSLIDEGACDGFHLLPARLPEDLTAIAAHLIPCLRARGSRRAAYAGSTLRDHLGLPRPSVRFAELAPAP
jgi:alkanesulfonate monooxygenase SsuD/methylene tetrahydromethanopterin reductase-like flavin-dependent oxidoreductase (luciferase family)